MDETPFQPQALSPEETALEENTREGLRALFHWLVFPFPLTLIPLAWLSRLPFVGLLAGVAGLVVLIVWAMRARAAWGDKAGPWIARAWDTVFAFAVKGYQSVSRESTEPPAVADARIEGTTAVRAALMDSVEADIQVAGQLAAFRTQIDRLTLLNAESTTLTEEQRRTNELVIRQLRRNIADVEKAEAERTGVSLETHGPRPLFDALLPAEAAPAPRRAFLGAIPGFSFPFSWALAAVLAVTNLGTFWLWNGARSERDQAIEAAEQMAASNQRLTEALGDASQAHTVDTQRRIEQVRNEMEAIALEREREARRAALRRERNALENDPSLGPIDFGQRLPNLVEPASADGGGDGEPASPDPVGDVPS